MLQLVQNMILEKAVYLTNQDILHPNYQKKIQGQILMAANNELQEIRKRLPFCKAQKLKPTRRNSPSRKRE